MGLESDMRQSPSAAHQHEPRRPESGPAPRLVDANDRADERGVLHRFPPAPIEEPPDVRRLQRSSTPRTRPHLGWDVRRERDDPRDRALGNPRRRDGAGRIPLGHDAVDDLPSRGRAGARQCDRHSVVRGHPADRIRGPASPSETLVCARPFRGPMPSYRIPSDERVRDSLVRVFRTRPMVVSQRKLKQLVEKDLKGDERYRVGEPRLRLLAIDAGLVDLEIRCRDTEEMRSLVKCPVCGARVKKVRNMTVFGGTVTLGYRCERCRYWTGLKRRVPPRYVFSRRS